MATENFKVDFGGDQRVVLSQALLIYKNSNGSAFATEHPVRFNPTTQRDVIGEGKALTFSTIANLVRAFSSNAQVGSFLPETIISVGLDSLVWWVPPAKREIHFDCDLEAKAIGRESSTVAQPGLVMAATTGGWYVFAVKGNTRPKATSPLFQAPHFNVSSNGSICVGNVTLPKDYTTESMAAWEKAYFGSLFTHPNVPKLVNFPGGAYAFWRSMLDGKHKKFPADVLLDSGITVADLIAKVNGGKK